MRCWAAPLTPFNLSRLFEDPASGQSQPTVLGLELPNTGTLQEHDSVPTTFHLAKAPFSLPVNVSQCQGTAEHQAYVQNYIVLNLNAAFPELPPGRVPKRSQQATRRVTQGSWRRNQWSYEAAPVKIASFSRFYKKKIQKMSILLAPVPAGPYWASEQVRGPAGPSSEPGPLLALGVCLRLKQTHSGRCIRCRAAGARLLVFQRRGMEKGCLPTVGGLGRPCDVVTLLIVI